MSRLVCDLPQPPIQLSAANQETASKLELQTFAEPITRHGAGSPKKQSFFDKNHRLGLTRAKHEEKSEFTARMTHLFEFCKTALPET